MYLLYIDESGDPQAWDHDHFVLAGVAVHEGQVFRLGKQLDDIQSRFFPERQIPLGFHATLIRAGVGAFSKLPADKREQLMKAVYHCISTAGFPYLVVFATAMHVSAAQNMPQVLHDTFQDVLQRFNIFLVRQFKHDQPNKGLVIMDQAHEGRYRELFAGFKKTGTAFQGPLKNIIDIPYFGRSHNTRMIQLADFCSYAIFRRYVYDDATYFKQILPCFDRRAPSYPPDGLKHFTQVRCSCEACHWRSQSGNP